LAVTFSPFMEPRPRNLSMMEMRFPIMVGQLVECLGRPSVYAYVVVVSVLVVRVKVIRCATLRS
jgi:hypothetical protein